ncbi:MAG: signal peptidase I [Deltaproteobacteria bacterium]|nr:MAG: signal peptidase I [Deltaproteobacteria bacterium]PIE74932.1 MAG: signal peptidase I [Deltaproteobacteria bacterium]
MKEDSQDKKKKGVIQENVEAILFALVLALLIRAFIIQAYKIPSGSMEDTLLVGDHLLVSKFIYGVRMPFTNKTIIPFSKPKRGDIVVFKAPVKPPKDFIKRVIGLPGDKIEVRNKNLYINGKRYKNEPYIKHTDKNMYPARDDFGPVIVPENSYFMMGDNRDNSTDSRFIGFIPYSMLRGKALLVYWSWKGDSFGVRWSRIGHLLK